MSHSPTAAVPIQWNPDVVRRLDKDVEWALTSNPTGPAEIAGFLVGTNRPVIEVIDCQPVLLMQQRERASVLTGAGKREFERTLAAFRSIPENELSVIGFFRSHIEEGFGLTEQDRSLIRTCFWDSSQLVLLMRLTEDGSSSIKVFLGDQGQALSEFHSSGAGSGIPRWLEYGRTWRQRIPRTRQHPPIS